MAKDTIEKSNQLNLTVVALVALVAIVGLVALVMSAASVKTAKLATGTELATASEPAANTAGQVSADGCRRMCRPRGYNNTNITCEWVCPW